ncbi:MAG: hypothetical protein KF773_04035 [Deltaproteobacteria bacterium]|nr:hypothetical protein [Deltaproteobacteria bacterium]
MALRGVWLSTMILVPLFGFWLASSLAAYKNASQWLALLVGLLLFPLVPVGWDLFFVWRRSKRPPEKAILTRADRLVLRTLLVNGVFLAGMLWFARGSAIRALSVRGDWMLDGRDGAIARTLRSFLLGIADRLDSYARTHDYGESDDAPDPSQVRPRTDEPPEPPPEPPPPGVVPKVPRYASGWPFPDEADPKVANMPEQAQATIAMVGAYLREQFPDKKERVKAIHDYIALRLSYDEDALRRIMAGDYAHTPSQEAEDVFRARTGVCAGYAKLMVAIGKAAGLEVLYVTGHARASNDRLPADIKDEEGLRNAFGGLGHAWNAVKVDDEWHLVDITWDDPVTRPGEERKPVYSTYLMAPPRLFAFDHLPENKAWQLLESPLSAGEFARQPMLKPSIGRFGLTLVSPTRSQVSANGEITIVLENPYAARLMATVSDRASDRCTEKTEGTRTEIVCPLERGEHEVTLFAAPAKQPGEGDSYRLDYIGTILVNSR